MNAFFAPAVRLMNRLKYPQKFLLVGLVLVLPLALVMTQYIAQINLVIDFAAKEQLGLQYNTPLIKFLQDVQQHAGMVHAYLSGNDLFKAQNQAQIGQKEQDIDADVAAMDAADQKLGGNLAIGTGWADIKNKWESLKPSVLTLSVDQSTAAHDDLMKQAVALIIISGNNSNLILDPDIDSYYLMDLVINKLPQLTDNLSQIRSYATAAEAYGLLTAEDRTRLIIWSGLASSTLDGVERDFSYIFGYNSSLSAHLQAPLDDNHKAVQDFLDRINNDVVAQSGTSGVGSIGTTTDSGQLFQTTTTDIDGVYTFYGVLSPQLNDLLQIRINHNVQQRNMVLAFALLALAISVYLFEGFYKAVMNAIANLDHASKRMIRGQMEGELVLENRDELAQVAISFNNIATELLATRDKALDASRAKSSFLANMSHELRTPLNAIIGYSELIEEECEELQQEAFVPDLRKIQAAAKHLLALINDILDLSKIEAGKMDVYLETIKVMPMINDVVSTVTPLMEKNDNKLMVNTGDQLGTMWADLTKVRQVLFNLLSNASKFTKNGTITLNVRRETINNVEWLNFTVTDTGIGMTPDQMAKLFKDFSQADQSTTRKYGGTGLGLSISKRFCQMMGGNISVASEVSKGSTFTVLLPATVSKAILTPLDTQEIKIPTPPGSSTILVIDDDPTVHELMQRSLGKEGFCIEVAGSGQEGLKRAKELHPDMITLDVMMPSMDGWAVLTALKADPELSSIPVIMMTIVNDQSMGYALGASEYLTKPIDKEKLLKILRKYECETSTCSVLVVEDDPAIRELMTRMLEKEGWTVEEAENGRIALHKMENIRPGLILLDLMMPEMDGFEFITELQKNESSRDIPIVVVTAMELTPEDRKRLNGHVEQVIQKGAYSREKLLAEVHSMVMSHIGQQVKQEVPQQN